jgi:hypothetical protein
MTTRHAAFAFIISAIVLFASSSVVVAITIDAFTDPFPPNPDLPGSGQQVLFVGTEWDPLMSFVSHPVSDVATQSGLPGVLGGDRRVELNYVSGTASVIILNGLSFNNDAGGKSTLALHYGAAGDLNADLTVYGGTQLEVNVLDGDMYAGPRPIPCAVTVTSHRGTPQEVTATVTQDLVSSGVYAYPFTSFTGVDFGDTDMITVVFNASQVSAVDVLIGSIETDGNPVPVAPTTWGHVKSLWE